MRDNLELNKDEVIKICKKQLVSNYVFSILFSILAIAIIAFFVINAINNEKSRTWSIIFSVLILLAVLDLICKTVKKNKTASVTMRSYKENIELETVKLTPSSRKYIKFVPKGVTSDQNLYYAFIDLEVKEDEKNVLYTYISRRPLKINVDDLLDNKEITCQVFKGTHVIDSILEIEKENI
jgi:hypothetical protein